MLKVGRSLACQVTGFVEAHAAACESVADRLKCIILFREPGQMAQGLIQEHYCMKGFRIDTKSCNWGPAAGFVCVDPRLTKDSVYVDRNTHWTAEAVTGHIVEKFFGNVADPDWIADVMPIVISKKRIEFLTNKGIINPLAEGQDYVGLSKATKGDTILPWRLVPTGNATNKWLKVNDGFPSGYYVLCINKSGSHAFAQRYPGGVKPITFRGHETILGLINPGTQSHGFKACVTADYDLFSIWPMNGDFDSTKPIHFINYVVANHGKTQAATLPGGVVRSTGIQDRLKASGHMEHHRFGDVSGRVMLVKTLLNSALMGAAGFQGGNAIHHNDEAGNFALAKGNLAECFPLISFAPGGTILTESLADFKELVLAARDFGFAPVAKPAWLQEAGIPS